MSDATASRQEVTPSARYTREWAAVVGDLPTTRPSDLGLRAGASVLVVVAHPDDETFGAGATIASLTELGVRVHVLALTGGEAALDHVGIEIAGLAERRRREFAAACAVLGAGGTVAGLPDSRLREFQADVDEVVAAAAERHRADHIVSVWWEDPHPDHQAAGRAALRAAHHRGCPVTGFAIWALHWSSPKTVLSESDFTVFDNDAAACTIRAAAVGVYQSQLAPLHARLEPILPPWFADQSVEIATTG